MLKKDGLFPSLPQMNLSDSEFSIRFLPFALSVPHSADSCFGCRKAPTPMSFSTIAGVFLKLPRLFLRICHWVLARMALHCKASGLNGGFPMSSTAKEWLRGTNNWKWRRILIVLLAVTVVIGAIWVSFDWNCSSFSRKDNILNAWRESSGSEPALQCKQR